MRRIRSPFNFDFSGLNPAVICRMSLLVQIALPFIAAAVLVCLTGCKSESQADWALREQILILGNGAEPRSLDPGIIQSVGDSNIALALFEGLVNYHPESDLLNEPGVAKEWKSEENDTLWTFFLRDNAQWSNGEPVTAHDFVYSYRRTLSPGLASPYASMLYFLDNAKQFNESNFVYFLCGEDASFPVSWEILKTIDLYATDDGTRPQFNQTGLNLLSEEELLQLRSSLAGQEAASVAVATGEVLTLTFAVLAEPAAAVYGNVEETITKYVEALPRMDLFKWPLTIPSEVRFEIVDRLLSFHQSGTDLWEIADVGVKALDDFTLECRLYQPTPFFPGVVKHQTWYPVHPPTIEKFGGMTKPFSPWQRPGNHVGNGAFQLKEWQINRWVKVERNPHYWDRDRVQLREIWFIPADAQTEERMFRDGLIHSTYVLPPYLIDLYREERPEILRTDGYLGTYFYRCNTNRPPLDDPLVRRALAMAIDRQAIVEKVTLGGQLPSHSFTPPIEDGYQPPNLVRFDPEKAMELLQQSKYYEDFPKFELIINTSESHKAVAETIQEMWRDHLGLGPDKVTINNQEWKVFLATVFDERYDVARSGWIADYVDPTTFLDMWRTGDSNNNTGWGNPDYDRLLKEAAWADSPEQREQLLFQAEEILLAEMPVIPIYHYTSVFLHHPGVENWNELVLKKHPYKHVRLVPGPRP